MLRPAVGLLVTFAAASALYVATLAPGVVWGDGATMAVRVFRREPFEMATAGNHPLLITLGQWLAPVVSDVALLMNLLSAFFGALTVMLVYRTARQLGTSAPAAATGAAALCVSHAFWLHSVVAEVYSANAFFLAATISALLAWRARPHWTRLAAAAVAFGVGLTNHLVLATVLPAAIVFVALERRDPLSIRRAVLFACLALGTMAAIVALTWPWPARALRSLWIGPPGIAEYLSPTIDWALIVREAGFYLVFLLYQFPSISLVLVLLGMRAIVQTDRSAAVLLLLTVAVNAAIFIRHTGWQSAGTSKYVFYIADYVVFGILCARGADELIRLLPSTAAARRGRIRFALLALTAVVPPVLYAAVPAVATRAGIDLVKARPMAGRDNQRYFLNPDKRGEDSARRFAVDALAVVAPSAVIYADFTPFSVLQYMQVVEGLRPDVTLRTAAKADGTVLVEWPQGSRSVPIYVARTSPGYYDFSRLGEHVLVPAGPIFEVRPDDGR